MRNDVSNAVNAFCSYVFGIFGFAENIACRSFAGSLAFKSYIVNKIVNMKNVSASKNALVRGNSELVDNSTV